MNLQPWYVTIEDGVTQQIESYTVEAFDGVHAIQLALNKVSWHDTLDIQTRCHVHAILKK